MPAARAIGIVVDGVRPVARVTVMPASWTRSIASTTRSETVPRCGTRVSSMSSAMSSGTNPSGMRGTGLMRWG